ncbi:hypothetical protein R3W88_024505 [Solanum pinnatisectum]|uniref:Uncharacterized protein n=1 Tax=Solanum pinnatisectum TaxID=50273 RepID=A0AAV9M4A7_9SOLN|nr:hypothetical protein R3W88_024505 [Solanum pinnatisectum]
MSSKLRLVNMLVTTANQRATTSKPAASGSISGETRNAPAKLQTPATVEDACNFFRWRDREDVDIRSKYVISRLTKRIKELEEALTSYESRVKSNQVVMKVKKKSKCCNLKLIVLIIIVCFLFLSLTKNVKDGSCRCVQPKLP